MDIDFFDDGKHSGSGLGSSDNGPVPTPGPVGQAAYDIATSAGTPIESSTRLDGLADAGFDDNGAAQIEDEAEQGHPSPDSISQPDKGQTGYSTGLGY